MFDTDWTPPQCAGSQLTISTSFGNSDASVVLPLRFRPYSATFTPRISVASRSEALARYDAACVATYPDAWARGEAIRAAELDYLAAVARAVR